MPPGPAQEPDGYDGAFLAFCRSFARAAGIFSIVVGIVTLLGWLLGVEIFLRTFPGMIVMKANAAFALVLLGISLGLVAGDSGSRMVRGLSGGCAALAGLLGLLTLIEHVTGADLGIDQLLAVEAPGALKTASPGRMAPNAALDITLLGSSLLLLSFRRGHRIVSWMAAVSMTVAFLALMGYAYASETFIGFGSLTHIAAQTALALLALSAGALLSTKELGLMEPLARNEAGSRMARWMLPAVIIVPFALALLRYELYRRGLVADEFGVAVMVVVGMAVLAAVVWRNAVALNRSDSDRMRQEKALATTTEVLEKIFSTTHMKMAYLDPEFRFVRVNQAYADACGHPPEFFPGKNHFDLYPHPENEAIFREVIRTGEAYTVLAKPFEFPDHPEWGVSYWDWTLQLVRGEDGRAEGLLFCLLDVTTAKEMERAAYRQDKLAILGQTAAGIAHDIRNPLQGVLINLSVVETLLEESAVADPEAREMIRTSLSAARSASDKIEGVVRRVMDFVRPTRARFGSTEINVVVREAVDLVGVSLRNRGIRLTTALSGGLPPCNADARLIEQLILNLVTNAAQAIEKPDGARRIEVSTGRDGDAIVIRVADSGPGVAESERKRIFDPFFTTKELGTGLGLSISRRIVVDHSGSIDVGTSRFGGAEFTVRLPVSPQAASGRDLVVPGRESPG